MEEEEQNNEGGCESTHCLRLISTIEYPPEKEASQSENEGKKQVGEEVDQGLSDEQILAKETVEGDKTRRDIGEGFGSVIHLIHLTGPV